MKKKKKKKGLVPCLCGGRGQGANEHVDGLVHRPHLGLLARDGLVVAQVAARARDRTEAMLAEPEFNQRSHCHLGCGF